MPFMNIGGSKDPRKATKARQKARAAAFSDVDNQRVAQAIRQSQNGFKGESKNDHGLPDGREGREIIQSKGANDPESNAKFRKQKYAEGTDSIKVSKKKSRTAETEAASERAEPTKLAKVEAPEVVRTATMKLPTGRNEVAELPDAISDSKRADMDKVRAHQTKLNKYGAGLEVDGMWGAKTEAASRELYPKYKQGLSSLPGKSRLEKKSPTSSSKPATTKASTTIGGGYDGKLSGFMALDSAKQVNRDAVAREKDAQQRRDAREVELRGGDADSGQAPLNRSQAKKMASVEERDDHTMAKVVAGIGGGALLGTAGVLAVGAIKGKRANNRAIVAAAKAGRKLPKQMSLGAIAKDNIANSKVGTAVRNTKDKIAAPFKEAKAVKKVYADQDAKAAKKIENAKVKASQAEEARYMKFQDKGIKAKATVPVKKVDLEAKAANNAKGDLSKVKERAKQKLKDMKLKRQVAKIAGS